MAIKAKIKAKAPEPLFIDFWSIFLASNRVFGRHYHPKKFQAFLWCIARFRGGCGMNGERVAWIFHSFFNFQPSFLIIIENIFGIFFLNMIEGVVIFIWFWKFLIYLYYIWLRQRPYLDAFDLRTTCGVPLDPAWPQDQSWIGGDPDFRFCPVL